MGATFPVGVAAAVMLAYLSGAIPVGALLARRFAGADIRRQGSGNIGATNVARVAGAWLGAATLAADLLKGWLPALAAARLAPAGSLEPPTAAALAAVAAVLGHVFPVYTAFRGGGKGVATAAGGFAAACPASVLAAAALFLAVALATRRVSAGSLVAAACLPIFGALFSGPAVAVAAAAAGALIFLRHRDNIRRLLGGVEPPFAIRRRPPPR